MDTLEVSRAMVSHRVLRSVVSGSSQLIPSFHTVGLAMNSLAQMVTGARMPSRSSICEMSRKPRFWLLNHF